MKLVVNVPYLPTSFGSKDILVKNILDFYFYLNLIAERIFEFMMKIKSIFARDSTENGLKKQQQVTVAASHSSKPQQQLEPATTGAARVVEGVAATAVTALFFFQRKQPNQVPNQEKNSGPGPNCVASAAAATLAVAAAAGVVESRTTNSKNVHIYFGSFFCVYLLFLQ